MENKELIDGLGTACTLIKSLLRADKKQLDSADPSEAYLLNWKILFELKMIIARFKGN